MGVITFCTTLFYGLVGADARFRGRLMATIMHGEQNFFVESVCGLAIS